MSELVDLDLVAARDGLRKKDFTAVELCEAHIAQMQAARPLNAVVHEVADVALAMAAQSDARLAAGSSAPLEGLPIGVKDLFCTKGVQTTACSNILGNFTPTYESTVTQNLWDAGAVMLGKLNNDEFAMGSSNETSRFGAVISKTTCIYQGKDFDSARH